MGVWAGASDTAAKYVHSGQTEIAATGQSRTAQALALLLAVFFISLLLPGFLDATGQ